MTLLLERSTIAGEAVELSMVMDHQQDYRFEEETAGRARRANTPWEAGEDARMFDLFEVGMIRHQNVGRAIFDAAISLGRTYFAVQTRLRTHARWPEYRQYEQPAGPRSPRDDQPLGDVCPTCRLELPLSGLCGWCA